MQIKRHKRFKKKYKSLTKKIQLKAEQVLLLFQTNPYEPSSRNHALNGDYIGFRSIDVTGDYRIIFRELSYGVYELVELIDIGTHSQLY